MTDYLPPGARFVLTDAGRRCFIGRNGGVIMQWRPRRPADATRLRCVKFDGIKYRQIVRLDFIQPAPTGKPDAPQS